MDVHEEHRPGELGDDVGDAELGILGVPGQIVQNDGVMLGTPLGGWRNRMGRASCMPRPDDSALRA
jgi:hypothetical protein